MSTEKTLLAQALAALQTTAGNIKSLRSCYPCATFDPWLKTVEEAVAELKALSFANDWCASVDAELAATEAEDAALTAALLAAALDEGAQLDGESLEQGE